MTAGIDSINGGWFLRKDRKRRFRAPTEEGRGGGNGDGGGVVNVTDNSYSPAAMTTDDVDESSTSNNDNKATPYIQSIPSIPASLAPFLGWTKLSSSASCRRRRIRQRQQDVQRARRLMALSDLEEEEEEGVFQKIDGHAIFFIHDPLLDNSDENDDDVNEGKEEAGEEEEEKSRRDGDKLWFQGRFFPNNKNNNTSVDSWGILAESGANDIDDCLLCPNGGYRILDMTFLRRSVHAKGVSMVEGTKNSNRPQYQYRRRWTARDLVWTGGNMMALATENYSLSPPPSLMSKKKNNTNGNANHDQAPWVNFEPWKLIQGKFAISLASKYFPQLVRRLQVRDIMEDGTAGRSLDDAMVLIGNMQVSAPASFVTAPPGGEDETTFHTSKLL